MPALAAAVREKWSGRYCGQGDIVVREILGQGDIVWEK
jgi:hypothetical protein